MDLQQLFSNGAGPVGAGFAGQEIANQQNATDLKNMFDQQMNPLKIQQQQGMNAQQDAHLPGVVGQSQSLAAQGQVDQALIADKIKTAQADALSKMDKEHVAALQQFGDKMGSISQMLGQVPVPARAAAFKQLATQYGIPADHPMMEQMMSANPEQLPDLLSNMSKGIATNTSGFIERKSIADEANKRAIEVAGIGANARRDVADIQAASKAAALQAKADAVAKNTEQELLQLNRVPPAQRDADWQRRVQSATAIADFIGQTKQPGLPVDIISGNKPTNGAGRAAAANTSLGAGGQPQTALPQNIEAAATAAWGAHEPNKYEYRMGPNGIQRRPK